MNRSCYFDVVGVDVGWMVPAGGLMVAAFFADLHPWPVAFPRWRNGRWKTPFAETQTIHVVQNGRTIVIFRSVAHASAQLGRLFLICVNIQSDYCCVMNSFKIPVASIWKLSFYSAMCISFRRTWNGRIGCNSRVRWNKEDRPNRSTGQHCCFHDKLKIKL